MSLFSASVKYSWTRVLLRTLRDIKVSTPAASINGNFGGYLKRLRFHSAGYKSSSKTTATLTTPTVPPDEFYSPLYDSIPTVYRHRSSDAIFEDNAKPQIPMSEKQRLVELLKKLGYESPVELLNARKVLRLLVDYEGTDEFSAGKRYEALSSDEILLLLKYFYNRPDPGPLTPTATIQRLGDILLQREELDIPIFSIYTLHIYSKLFYHHIPLLERCSATLAASDLATLLPARRSMLVLACSALKWLDEGLFDKLATLEQPDKPFSDFVHYLLCSLAKLNYLPVGEHALFEMLHSEAYCRQIVTGLNRSRLLNLCWSLCVLNLQPNLLLNKVLNPKFVQSSLEGFPPHIQKVNLSRLRQINTSAFLEHPYYTGPFLKLSPKWAHQVEDLMHYGPLIHTEVVDSLVDCLGSGENISINAHTPYGYVLEAEMLLDEYGTALPPSLYRASYSNNKNIPEPPPNSKWVTLIVQNFSHYTSVKKHLLGKHAMKKRHLQLLGYGIIEVPFFEWQKLQEKDTRISYLEERVKRALES